MYGVLVSCSDAKVRLMRCNSRTVNRPTRSFTIRTDCTDRQIVLLPDQQIDAYNYQTVNGLTTTFSV